MALLNAVTASASLTTGGSVTLYTCPSTKSHAIVDLVIFKPNTSAASVDVAVSTTAYASLTQLDYIAKGVSISTDYGTFFINKIVVGKNESIYVVATTGSVNVRMSGVEEANPNIGLAGKIGSINFTGATALQAYKTVTANTVLSVATLSVRNTNATAAVVDLYVTSGGAPVASDLFNKITINGNQYATYSNLFIKSNEAVYVKSSLDNTYCYVNGFVQVTPP